MVKLVWHIGDVVRKLRDEVAQLSQTTLGELVEPVIRPNTVSDFEKGQLDFKESTLNRLLEALNNALQDQKKIRRPLRKEDLYRLIPAQRADDAEPLAPPDREMWDAYQQLPEPLKDVARSTVRALRDSPAARLLDVERERDDAADRSPATGESQQ